ncbi:cation:proton antiporter domain-containing protein [Phenylobacterium montanum]|uniref:Cation:proton antiporter n=1 Tax=Phenylobacterium montanum TaxID=2823693 RepID=A0A975FWN7_9CAUL|nr:cation:proton antiporter [Caulobacter sp. S6]QUD86334.1 cation:proton antiporter [Caulobacter sp. S6]
MAVGSAGGGAAAGYKDLVLFLATAGIVAPLFKRLKISPVLGFLGAGVLLGPSGLGALAVRLPWLGAITVARPEDIADLAEFGVVFLLFMIGLELSWERLRLMRRLVFGLGPLQMLACGAALTGLASLAGASLPAALAIGAALTLSSTAVVIPVMAEHRRLHAEAGRATLSVLLFQDLSVAPIIITLGVVAKAQANGFDPRLLLAVLPAVAAIVAIVAIGRLLLRPMLKSVARARSEEMFLAACLLVVIGAGLISAVAGLSMAIGAFVAGLLLAETEYRHEVEVTIEPFKGLLLGLFFLSVGIDLDLSRLAQQPLLILGLAAGLILVKFAPAALAARVMGLKLPAAVETGLNLAAGGEFAFVLLNTAIQTRLVPAGLGESVLVAATLTMFAIPLLGALGATASQAASKAPAHEPPPPADPAAPPRVLVIGYGRVGRLVGEMLTRHKIDWIAADRDAHNAEAARRGGKAVYFGDAARIEFLRRLGLMSARGLVVTMDSPEGAEAVVGAARQARPDLTIVARARDARQAKRLYELGATDAVPETIEASLQLSEAVLVDIGVPMGLVIASVHEARDDFRKELNRPDALGARVRKARDAIKGRSARF